MLGRVGLMLGCTAMLVCAGACRRTRAPQPREAAGADGGNSTTVWRAQVQLEPEGQLPAPDAALACYSMARFQLDLSDPTAFNLCRSAPSNGPAECFGAGRDRTRLADAQLVVLCRCANSSAPVDCYTDGVDETFLIDDQLIALCNGTNTQQLRADCSPRY